MISSLKKKAALVTFKYAPIFGAFLMTLNAMITLQNPSASIINILCGFSGIPLLIAYQLSKALCFCKLH